MSRTRSSPRKRPETERFRLAILRFRAEGGATQGDLAARLGISRKTLSNWECGYWLPPFKQRLHLVLAFRDAAPEHVLELADGLGVSGDPAVEPLLKPYRDALYGTQTEVAEAPAPPPVRPRPTPEQLRGAADAAVREAADALNARPNDVRAAVTKVLAACAALGGSLEETQGAMAVREATTAKAV